MKKIKTWFKNRYRPIYQIEESDILLECDNDSCDFVLKRVPGFYEKITEHHVGTPCPKCGESLLTFEDYYEHKKLMDIINWINKYFSWVTIFSPPPKQLDRYRVKVHKGTKFTKL